MATLLTNVSQGAETLPPIYSSLVIGASTSVIIEDTIANVKAAILRRGPNLFTFSIVPDGQPGAIYPSTIDSPAFTSNIVTVYVSLSGEDDNPARPFIVAGDYGTWPFRTLNAALAALPIGELYPVRAVMDQGTFPEFNVPNFTGSYPFVTPATANPEPALLRVIGAYPLSMLGSGPNVGTAGEGSTNQMIVVADAGWTVHGLRGLLCEIDSGPGAPTGAPVLRQYTHGLIIDNTDDTLIIEKFVCEGAITNSDFQLGLAVGEGSVFRIVGNGTIITGAATDSNQWMANFSGPSVSIAIEGLNFQVGTGFTGALLANGSRKLLLSACKFTSPSAQLGATFIDCGNVSMSNCYFQNLGTIADFQGCNGSSIVASAMDASDGVQFIAGSGSYDDNSHNGSRTAGKNGALVGVYGARVSLSGNLLENSAGSAIYVNDGRVDMANAGAGSGDNTGTGNARYGIEIDVSGLVLIDATDTVTGGLEDTLIDGVAVPYSQITVGSPVMNGLAQIRAQ